MPTAARTKKAKQDPQPVTEEAELEDLTEEPVAEEAPKPKRTAKAKKVEEKPAKVILPGKTTREVGEMLGVAPVKLRRILRGPDFLQDEGYTAYRLDDETIERLRKAIEAGNVRAPRPAGEPKARTKKEKAAAKAAPEAEEVTDELEDLDVESDGDDEATLELEGDEDEADEDEEESDDDLEDEEEDEE